MHLAAGARLAPSREYFPFGECDLLAADRQRTRDRDFPLRFFIRGIFGPMTKSPGGTTTSSGQSLQSLKISPGSGLAPFCATTASGADAGRSTGPEPGRDAGGLMVNPRCAFTRGPATAAATARKVRNNSREFMVSFPSSPQPNALSTDAQRAQHASFHGGRQGERRATCDTIDARAGCAFSGCRRRRRIGVYIAMQRNILCGCFSARQFDVACPFQGRHLCGT
jgi:hypothetical protein